MEASEKLFYDNIEIVNKIVNRMHYNFVEKDDLVQAGLIGLNMASKKYNSNNGASFASFATFYIIGEIKREMRNNSFIHLSKEMFKIIKVLNKNDDKSIDEIAKELNTSKENVILALNYKEKVISLNKENDDNELLDFVSSNENDNNDKKQVTLHDIKKCLDGELYNIIYSRYFLKMTQYELACSLNKSQSKISRLEKKALKKLKKNYLEKS